MMINLFRDFAAVTRRDATAKLTAFCEFSSFPWNATKFCNFPAYLYISHFFNISSIFSLFWAYF